MTVVVTQSAVKDFRKISEPYKSAIKEKIKGLEEFPAMKCGSPGSCAGGRAIGSGSSTFCRYLSARSATGVFSGRR